MPEWQPPLSFEERLKLLIPPKLYLKGRAAKELRRGEPEVRLLPSLVDPSRAALDIGANKGVWTYFLQSLTPQVHAFEPNPKLYRTLRRGIAARVKTYRIALSDQNGTAEFRIPRQKSGYSNQGGTLSAIAASGNYRGIPVETRRLDDLEIPNIGFMKIDVEGSELAVLEGASQTIERDHPILVVEMEERHTNKPLGTIVGAVLERGYRSLCLRQGILTPFEALDIEKYHRQPASKADYVNNFIFLPV